MKAPADRFRAAPSWPFWTGLGAATGLYALLITGMLAADAAYTSPDRFWNALQSREILYAIQLSVITCTITSVLSLWIAVPAGYLLARGRFPGRQWLDAVMDIPIVLPPLVIGISLLILFQGAAGRWLEAALPAGAALFLATLPVLALHLTLDSAGGTLPPPARRAAAWLLWLIAWPLAAWALLSSPAGNALRALSPLTYNISGVVAAQFTVAAAFSVKAMRSTFEHLPRRPEQVAMTLGCSAFQAFHLVALPCATRGMMHAATLAWARSMGEFGPILVFAGATRLKTEVLPTTVFLEFSVGNLEAAVAVSLLMVLLSIGLLALARACGGTGPVLERG